jgi:PBP1b-binding outer membrane lipoprotein LpoB
MKKMFILTASLVTAILLTGCFGSSSSTKSYEKDESGFTKGDVDTREGENACTRSKKDELGYIPAG